MSQFASSQLNASRVQFEEAKAAREDQHRLKVRRIHRLAHQVRRIESKGGRRHA